ncbi:MAG: hypothetical protein RLZZ495_156 [Pseudomonadota bacterium]|jgi:uncharacterized integral membrane protein
MKTLLRAVQWLLKAALFFTLFAFALNNQNDVTVHFFFGRQWTAPLVLVVLIAFSAGLLIGVLGMIPRWLQQRKKTSPLAVPSSPSHAINGISNGLTDGI